MNRLKILFVEDNRLLRWWITAGLESEGYSVLAPHSTDEATSLASGTKFDLLITDCQLSNDCDGFEVLACVRKNRPETPAILISARPCTEMTAAAKVDNFDLILEKPFPLAELVSGVQRLAESRNSGLSQVAL